MSFIPTIIAMRMRFDSVLMSFAPGGPIYLVLFVSGKMALISYVRMEKGDLLQSRFFSASRIRTLVVSAATFRY